MQDWFLLIWAVICVVLVLGLAYWFTRNVAGRSLAGRFSMARGSGRIQIVEQQVLGRDQRLAVVRVSGKYYLLGITAEHISLISEITWGTEPLGTAEQATEKPTFHEAFFDALKQKARR